MNIINSTFSLFLRFLFPIRCVGCGIRNSGLCYQCFKKVRRASPLPFPYMNALYVYKDPLIKKILWEAKYHHKTPALEALIKHSISDIEEYISSYSLSEHPIPLIIIPIPTSKTRKHIRGYNIPTIIARTIAHHMNIKYLDVLTKKRHTEPQSTMPSRQARYENVHHSLTLTPTRPIPTDALIILIDDIITTGATAQEAVRVLKEKGYNPLVLALAHGA